MYAFHEFIAGRFCKDRSRGNTHVFSIAFNNTFVRDITKGLKTVTVNNNIRWQIPEFFKGSVHGFYGGVQDINPVYNFRVNVANSKADCRTFNNWFQCFTVSGRQQFGVIKAACFEIPWQNYSGSGNRACQTSPAGFIRTGFKGVMVIKA